MKFGLLAGGLVLLAGLLVSCSSNSATPTSGSGFVYVTTEGNTSLSSFSIDFNTGGLTSFGKSVSTGSTPIAMVPSGSTLWVLNGPGTTPPSGGSISAFALGSDGSVSASSSTTAITMGVNAKGLAVAPNGKFLFVANQGTYLDATNPPSHQPGTISVFSISGTGASGETAFPTELQNAPVGSGPSAVAVTPDGKYLYVANFFAGTVNAFSIDATTGALTAVANSISTPYLVGTAPSAMTVTPDGGVLYVTNSGGPSISAFAICNQVKTSCPDVNNPDGTLHPVADSPFSTGLSPMALAIDPLGKYLYVVDQGSNQVSQYQISSATGKLTALSPATISTGTFPFGVAIHSEVSGGTLEYVYVSNFGSDSISAFKLDTTTGLLSLSGTPVVSTSGQPSAVAVE